MGRRVLSVGSSPRALKETRHNLFLTTLNTLGEAEGEDGELSTDLAGELRPPPPSAHSSLAPYSPFRFHFSARSSATIRRFGRLARLEELAQERYPSPNSQQARSRAPSSRRALTYLSQS